MSGIPHTNITRMVVKNYRSLTDVDIALHPLTVLVGENGSGKSNTLDVLRFVRDVMRDGFEIALKSRGGVGAIRCWYADEMEDISIRLYFEGPLGRGDYGFVFGRADEDEDEYAIKSERLFIVSSQAQEMLLEAQDGKLTRYPEQIGVMPMGHPFNAYHARTRYNMTPFLPQLAPFSRRLQGLLYFLAKMNFYDFWPDNLRPPQKIVPPFPLREDGANLASTLRELKRTGEDQTVQEALSVVIKGFRDYSIAETNGLLVPKLHYCVQNGRVKEVAAELQHEADGTIRFLAILAALYQERYLSPLSIEEPETAIYPDALGMLYDVLREASVSYQVLLTTHSADLISYFPAESLRILNKEDGITKIGPLSKSQYEAITEKLFSPGALMRTLGLERKTEMI
jgi:predicted ATPase